MLYAAGMTRTHKSVGYSPKSKPHAASKSRDCSPEAAAEAFELLEGRWKLVIIHNLFDREGAASPVMRFSELERAIPKVSQKMLIQQLRCLERDGIVQRTIHAQVPPKVEYQLTSRGRALRPTLRALLDWAGFRKTRSLA
jgi:DNA-binding HxlR family transcriptional regulator